MESIRTSSSRCTHRKKVPSPSAFFRVELLVCVDVDCLVTGTDGSVYPTPHSFISYFDIRPPELSLMFSESLVVGSEMVLVLETSEQVTLVDSIDSIVVSGGELVGLASVSKTLFILFQFITRRYIAEVTINATFQMTVPRSTVRDLAGNNMASNFTVALTPGIFCSSLFSKWDRLL